MNEKFVFVSVLPETREQLRLIASKKDKSIYKVIRDIVDREAKKTLKNANSRVK